MITLFRLSAKFKTIYITEGTKTSKYINFNHQLNVYKMITGSLRSFISSFNESITVIEDLSIKIDSNFLTNVIFYYSFLSTLIGFFTGLFVGCMMTLVFSLVFHKTLNKVSNIFAFKRERVSDRLFNIPPESDVDY